MHVNSLHLLSDESSRGVNLPKAHNPAEKMALNVEVQDATGKPWPNEVVVSVKLGDPGAESSTFSCKLRYAVEFSEPPQEHSPGPLKAIWPFVRADLLGQMNKYDISVNGSLPFNMGEE
ncbi:hypothetical protein KIM372_04500 [Bombiscardovia nodaiensis]|uniref:Uncharacterized protein n=1 Tax=Bombiscardovia nodaiensis TaxID=2932181 RepID=A0ABN6SAP5_9BIFI|nr:hypothetical protein KIM372_04500 [Bombiscardovia nodaiensis]